MKKNNGSILDTVVDAIRQGGELSGSEIAKEIGCSATIVQNYLNDLTYDGVISRRDYYDGRGKNIVTYKYNRLRLFALRRPWTYDGMRGVQ